MPIILFSPDHSFFLLLIFSIAFEPNSRQLTGNHKRSSDTSPTNANVDVRFRKTENNLVKSEHRIENSTTSERSSIRVGPIPMPNYY